MELRKKSECNSFKEAKKNKRFENREVPVPNPCYTLAVSSRQNGQSQMNTNIGSVFNTTL